MLVVFLIPNFADPAVRISKLLDHFSALGAAGRLGLFIAATPLVTQAVDSDCPQPSSKRSGSGLSLKVRETTDDNSHHLLNDIVDISCVGVMAT